VNKPMQRGAKAAPGMTSGFRLEPDPAVHVVRVPAELRRALSEERSLRRWFNGLNHSVRNDICKRMAQAKRSTVRWRRAERMAECLLATMEAERELPPAFQIALAQNSLAREGWRSMSASGRRSHLFGISYDQSPGARARRMAKAIEDAVLFAQKRKNRK
jgi:uncharacterized protein YdeI (YjbR/CyaY-like superfamily)